MTTATVYDTTVFALGNFKRLGSTLQQAIVQCIPPNPSDFDASAWFTSKLANVNIGNPNPVNFLPITFCDPATFLVLQTYNITSITASSSTSWFFNTPSPSAFTASLAGAVVFYIQAVPRVIDTTPPIVSPDFLNFNSNPTAIPSTTQLQAVWNSANT